MAVWKAGTVSTCFNIAQFPHFFGDRGARVLTLSPSNQIQMNPKATKDLAQLQPDDLIKEVSLGLELVCDNVISLSEDARFSCESARYRAGRILLAFAEEEAAKALILMEKQKNIFSDFDLTSTSTPMTIKCGSAETTFFSAGKTLFMSAVFALPGSIHGIRRCSGQKTSEKW